MLLLWLCTTVCPTECLTHTTDYEFAQFTLDEMKYDYLALMLERGEQES